MADIYLDNNATTQCDPKVVEAMLPFFLEQFGNPSSIHSFGADVGKALGRARKQIQALLGAAHDSEIILTSCGTESANIAFEYIEGEGILMLLNKAGIAASSGSACTPGSLEPSHVMRAMDIPYTAAHGTIRFSLSRYNTQVEVDRVIAAMPPIVAELRRLSPYWGEDGPITEPEKAFAPVYA